MLEGEARPGLASAPMEMLQRAFYARPAPDVAADVIGKVLRKPADGLAARIVEAEAYRQDDPASHAHRGQTARNAPMFGPPGHAYVYFSYGAHWCLNVVTGEDGFGEGVLLRAAQPLDGLELMRRRRGERISDRDLLRGPGRLGQAFALDRSYSGTDVCGAGPLCLSDDGLRPQVVSGPRVGVSLAADERWRFFAAGSPWVSAYKRSPRAPQAVA
jgi:DNA-3-methyladenine glycosylase